MRVAIIREDNAVIVDGERLAVDCTGLPADFHALQWNNGKGEIEYSVTRCDHCNARQKKGNEFVTDLSPYQPYIDAWHAAKALAEAARVAAEAHDDAAQSEH